MAHYALQHLKSGAIDDRYLLTPYRTANRLLLLWEKERLQRLWAQLGGE